MPIFLPLFRPYIKKVTTPELFPKLMLATAAKPEAEPRSLLKGIILTKPVNKNQVDSEVCPRFNSLVILVFQLAVQEFYRAGFYTHQVRATMEVVMVLLPVQDLSTIAQIFAIASGILVRQNKLQGFF